MLGNLATWQPGNLATWQPGNLLGNQATWKYVGQTQTLVPSNSSNQQRPGADRLDLVVHCEISMLKKNHLNGHRIGAGALVVTTV